MAYTFKFPDVGEGIHEGRIVEWLVAEGDTVVEDQPLVKVETDKAVVELPSPEAGTVLRLHAAADAVIEVGDPLVTIGDPSEAAPAASNAGATAPAPKPEVPEAPADPATPKPSPKGRPLATPRTRALARKLGVDLGGLTGTGSGGRITDEDVASAKAAATAAAEAAAGAGEAPAAAPAPVSAAPAAPPAPPAVPRGEVVATREGEVERVPITHLRKVISESMRRSRQVSAHVTHVDEADVTDLLAHHSSVKGAIEEADGVKFSLLPFFVKALVTVLKQYPMFNATVDEEAGEILLKRFYNIGIAVDTPEGLIVPVIKDADRKDMVALAAEVADLAARARSRELTLDELRGGTCTITNIGPLGGIFATPIINQPELAIVGLHVIKDRPVVVDGEIVVRKMMYMSVSFDHRWIDGADAARFMTDLVRLVSTPGLLMVRL
jgi:pyruvate dehydrogenase E2 component (dihydrolipoamide acetyltransferase)